MKVPTYLKKHVKDYEQKRLPTMTVCASDKSDLMEIWYYGDLYFAKSEGREYIVNTEVAPALVVAKHPATNEEIVLLDGAKHGYDNMFCDTYEESALKNRPLKKMDIPPSQIILEIGYSIDYEDEKEEYDFDENGMVVLIDGRRMSWEDVLLDGFDYIAISYINDNGEMIQFLDAELA